MHEIEEQCSICDTTEFGLHLSLQEKLSFSGSIDLIKIGEIVIFFCSFEFRNQIFFKMVFPLKYNLP